MVINAIRYSNGGRQFTPIPAGAPGSPAHRSPGRLGEGGIVNTIHEGDNMLITLENIDGDDQFDGSILINWLELDEDIFDALIWEDTE